LSTTELAPRTDHGVARAETSRREANGDALAAR
jgi:hypothetical protein